MCGQVFNWKRYMYKKLVIIALITITYVVGSSDVSAQILPRYKEYIVSLNDASKQIISQNEKTSALLRRHFVKLGIVPIGQLSLPYTYKVRLNDKKLLKANIQKYFDYVEPDYETNNNDSAFLNTDLFSPSAATVDPNDPELANSNSWGIDQFYGTNARDAWGFSTGTATEVVAVIGTGVDVNHPDLVNNIWTDSAPSASNKKETAKGFNIFNSSTANLPTDDHGITTFAAGVIAARGNNAVGTAGINWFAKIMPVKLMTTTASATISQFVEGIDYILRKKQAGANVTVIYNFKTFTADTSNALRNKIQEASNAGILFVTAAGDNGANVNSATIIPSNFTLPNVITVGSYYGTLNPSKPPNFSDVYYSAAANAPYATFNSNYGATKVHLAAPGERVRSCWKNSSYNDFAGTAVSAAYVAGAASLIKSYSPTSTMTQIKDGILNNVRIYTTELNGKVATKGVLDIFKAIKTFQTELAGDYDKNGVVDLWDYNVFKREFLGFAATKNSDGNKDSIVNQADYTIWRNAYNSPTAPALPTFKGDCDGDGDDDGGDFLAWQRSLGQTGPGLNCDMNADGKIDATDLSIWKEHFGQSS